MSKPTRVGISGLMGVGFVAYACQSSYVLIERSGKGENADVARSETFAMVVAVIDFECTVDPADVVRTLETEVVVVVFHGLIHGTKRNDLIASSGLSFLFHENVSPSLNWAV